MAREQFNLHMPKSFKERVKKAADYFGINMSQFIIQAVNEKLERTAVK